MATEQSVLAVIRASRPTFKNSADKIAFAVHAAFLSAGYQLHAAGPPAFSDDALTTSSSEEVGTDGWNEVEDNYAFVYSKPQKSSDKVLVKCFVMNDKLLLDALAAGSSDPVHLEINIADFVAGSEGMNYNSQFKDLGKLVDALNKEVLNKICGSSASSSSAEAAASTEQRREQGRGEMDVQARMSGGFFVPREPPLYDPSGIVLPPIYPMVGGGDLYPQAPAGMYPPRGRGDFGGGGMLVGPNDPRFGMGGRLGFPGGQPGVPPGARFDPYGPPNVPGFEPGRFGRNQRRPPGSGMHPDLEHFPHGSDFI